VLQKPGNIRVFGLTGGIGSGKSEVAAVLRAAGIPVIDADAIAREQARAGRPVFDALVAEFGDGIVGPDGELDRKALAAVAFADHAALARLNALTHGPVIVEVSRRLATIGEAGLRVAVVEAALIVETGLDAGLDGLIVVQAPEHERVERVRARDRVPADHVRARMGAQASDEARCARATRVVENTGSLGELRARAAALALELASSNA
jgi:dephospho-CoA kinase